MKHLLLLASFVILLTFKAYAQVVVSVQEAIHHVGETVTVNDKLISCKIYSDSLAVIELGNRATHSSLSVILTFPYHKYFHQGLARLFKSEKFDIRGLIVLVNSHPTMIINHSYQIYRDRYRP